MVRSSPSRGRSWLKKWFCCSVEKSEVREEQKLKDDRRKEGAVGVEFLGEKVEEKKEVAVEVEEVGMLEEEAELDKEVERREMEEEEERSKMVRAVLEEVLDKVMVEVEKEEEEGKDEGDENDEEGGQEDEELSEMAEFVLEGITVNTRVIKSHKQTLASGTRADILKIKSEMENQRAQLDALRSHDLSLRLLMKTRPDRSEDFHHLHQCVQDVVLRWSELDQQINNRLKGLEE